MPTNSSWTETLLCSSLNPKSLDHQTANHGKMVFKGNLPIAQDFQELTWKYMKVLGAAFTLPAHLPITARQWRDLNNPFFLRALALEEWAGILLPGLATFSIRLIQFVASPAGIPCPEGRKGLLWRINSRCWDSPNLWPLGKTHKLQMTKPPRKFIRTSGHLIRDLIKLSKVYPSPVFIKIACSWKKYAKDFLFLLFSFCFSFFFSPSSLAFIAINVDSAIVNKPHISRPVTYTATIKYLCLG